MRRLVLLSFLVSIAGRSASPEAALAAARKRIDSIDARIVALLNERAQVVDEIGRIKKQANLPVANPKREEEVLRNVAAASRGPLPPETVRRIYGAVIDEMKKFESRK